MLLIEDRVDPERSATSLVHSIIELEQGALGFGRDQRRLRVQKARGSPFREGFHDLSIAASGLRVYPALVAAEHRGRFIAHQVPSGIPALDCPARRCLDEGTSTLLMGLSGIGKSSVAAQHACAAARRGDVALFLMFDERLEPCLPAPPASAWTSRARSTPDESSCDQSRRRNLAWASSFTDSYGSRAAQCTHHRDRQSVGLFGCDAR